MKKLIIVLLISFISSSASATFLISDVAMTSNSVTFKIDGNMNGYSDIPFYKKYFSIEYFGDIFLDKGIGYPNSLNTWTTPVFDNKTIDTSGATLAYSLHNYTWSLYDSDSLIDATANNREVEVSTTDERFNPNATGAIAFYWGHPLEDKVELARFDINPVPEPAAMILFGLGLLGVAGVSRRKK